jgi:hypothetical protein
VYEKKNPNDNSAREIAYLVDNRKVHMSLEVDDGGHLSSSYVVGVADNLEVQQNR